MDGQGRTSGKSRRLGPLQNGFDLVGRARRRDGSIEGEIKITSLLPLTSALMKPIAAFSSVNPNCRVSITTTEDLQRLEHGEAHLALRAGQKPEHPDYVVQLLRQVALNLFAHVDYLDRMGRPDTPADLVHHQFVMPPKTESRLPIWAWITEQIGDPIVAVTANDPIVVRDAVQTGLGVGVLSEFDVAARDDRCALLPAHENWSVPLWLVTHVDLHRTEKVQEMLKHIKAPNGQDVTAPSRSPRSDCRPWSPFA